MSRSALFSSLRPGSARTSTGRSFPGTATINPTHPTATPAGRLLTEGAQSLSDAELLSILLHPSSRRPGPAAQALRLLRRHGGSLRAACRLRPEPPPPRCGGWPRASRDSAVLQAAVELSRRCLAEALAELPVIGSPAALRDFLALWLGERHRECFVVLFLNAQNRLIRAEEMFQGGVAQTFVYPREIAKKALELCATSIIVAHNHPSGIAEPSAADRHLTQGITEALRVLDIAVLDHVVIAGNRSFSFAEAQLI